MASMEGNPMGDAKQGPTRWYTVGRFNFGRYGWRRWDVSSRGRGVGWQRNPVIGLLRLLRWEREPLGPVD